MDQREKALYHQIHPAKLLMDIATAIIAFVLLWFHELLGAILIATVPSVVATILVIAYADLEPLKSSRLGTYLARYMNAYAQAARLLGFVVSAVGAWFQELPIVIAGVVIIVLAWSWGLFLRPWAR